MELPNERSTALHHAFWLATRGAQQMDLAHRFSAAAQSRGLRVLALKGISIADELYGGVWNRPMADIDFLVVDTPRFEAAGHLARELGLVEVGASDHALVFKEPRSGVVLELHVSLTACPGLFTVDGEALWQRKASVAGTSMFRLSDEDLVVHLALHTAFQHAFAANEYHYGDFVRALAALKPSPDRILARAREWGALQAVGAMTLACRRYHPESQALAELLKEARPFCPRAIERWIDSREEMPPPMSVASLAFVRYHLAPSKWGYVRQTLFPKPIPGRTLPGSGAIKRLARLIDAGLFSPAPPKAPFASTLPERIPKPEVAEQWIREALLLDPGGAQLTVSGTCMEPALMEGSRILLRPPTRSLRVGDVVLLRTKGGLRLHRVLLRFRDTIRTKGDQGNYLDPAAHEAAVIAVWDANESRLTRRFKAVHSLARLLARPWPALSRRTAGGDGAHAHLLP